MKRDWLNIKLAPDGGDGGGNTPPPAPPAAPPPAAPQPGAWRDSLPDDLRANPILATLPGVAELAKGYVHAQTLIGQKRLVVPGKDAKPEAWDEVYNTLGRPAAADKYSEPTVKLADGITLDKAGIDSAKGTFFKLGLTDSQAKGVLDFYYSGLNTNHEAISKTVETQRAAAEQTLKAEWGDKFGANLSIATGAVKSFAGEDAEALEAFSNGLGNDPAMVRLFYNIGLKMTEDQTAGGGQRIDINSEATALVRIAELKMDKVFQEALNNRSNPGHNDAVALWTQVHRAAPKRAGEEQ